MSPKARRLTLFAVLAAALMLSLQHARFLFSKRIEAYHDWDQHLFYAQVAVRAVRHFFQFPSWNPFPCGGSPLFAAPESRIYTPMFVLHLLFGAPVALRIEVVLHLLLAAVGMAFLVLEHLDDQTAPEIAAATSTVAALIFAGSTLFALQLAEGHLWILAAAYLPWVVLFFERGLERRGYAALAGAMLALMVGEGGIYPVPQTLLLLGLYAIALAVMRRSLGSLAVLAITGSTALLFAAPKLLPLAVLMHQHPRLVASREWLPLKAIAAALLARNQGLTRSFSWSYWPWHEQGAYVGVLGLGLSLVGLSISKARNRIFGGMALLAAMLAAGHFAAWAPWSLLHRVPPFRSQHVPSRFLLLVVFLIACLAGEGGRRVLGRLGARVRPWAAAGMVLFVAADIMSVRAGIFGPVRCSYQQWPRSAVTGHPFVTIGRPPGSAYCRPTLDAPLPRGQARYSAMAPAAEAGVAILDAYEPLCPRIGSGTVGREPGLFGMGQPGYQGEAWVDRGAGTVRIVSRTQNRMTLDLEVAPGSLVLLDQNWDPGWHVSEGAQIVDSKDRLGLRITGTTRSCRLWYRPPYFWLAILLALLGVALAIQLGRAESPRGRA